MKASSHPTFMRFFNFSSGGFVFQSKDILVDNTFEALVEQEKDDMRVGIGKVLFS